MRIFNKFFQLRSRQAGFSFMEVMIVVAIVGIMSAVGLVSLSASKNKKQLETETRKVVAVIREAQNNALTGKTISGFPCVFDVTFDSSDAKKYYLVHKYKDSISKNCDVELDRTTKTLASYELGYGVTHQANEGIYTIDFEVPFGTRESNTVETIFFRKNNFWRRICVCDSGKITEKEVTGNGVICLDTECG